MIGRAAATMTLRAFWSNPPPGPGQFMKSDRGRFAYEIVEARGKPHALGGWRGYLRVRRWAVADVPEGVTMHRWQWDARSRRRAPA